MTTGKNTKKFREWYIENIRWADGIHQKLPIYTFVLLPIQMQIGVYQQYYQQTMGWVLYIKPYSDKFSIHIAKFWDEGVLNHPLINNNYPLVQKELLEAADERMNEELENEDIWNSFKLTFEDILEDSFDEGTDGYINKRSELTGKIFMDHKDHIYETKENKLYFDCGPQIPTNALSDSVYIYEYMDSVAKTLGITLYAGEAENHHSIKADTSEQAYREFYLLREAIIADGFEIMGDI